MRNRRLARLFDRRTHRTLIVPLDHGLAQGPLAGLDAPSSLLPVLADAGANAVILNPGMAAACTDALTDRPELGLIVHLSAGSGLAGASRERGIVGSVAAALQLGADAVSVHLNVGSPNDVPQLAELARTVEQCRTAGLPLLAMMYLADGSKSPTGIGHAARMAAEIGADIVKIPFAGVEALHTIVRSVPCPVVAAGGPSHGGLDLLDVVDGVLGAHAAGLAVGRHVFQHPAPRVVTKVLGRVLRGRLPVETAKRMLAPHAEHAATG